jgi:hypothetical protein
VFMKSGKGIFAAFLLQVLIEKFELLAEKP